MTWWSDVVRRANDRTRDEGRWRAVRTIEHGAPRTRLADGTEVVSFASNDYLGLTQHPLLTSAGHAALDRFGTGSGASRLVVGSRPVHDELEAAIADWQGTEAALTFPSGYSANVGTIGALVAAAGRDDCVVLSDELNHASIIDGIRMSRTEVVVYRHNDVEHLEAELAARDRRHAIVVSDACFSMDGDVAPVDDLAEVCLAHEAMLVLDEAHAVLGPDSPRLDGLDLAVVGTMSKTLGSVGGFVAGPQELVDLVLNRARSFIFTTAPSPVDMATALAGLQVLRSAEGEALVARLRSLVDLLRPGHPSPIVPIVLGEEERAVGVADALLERGLLVPAIRPPTVAPGTCRLRIALSAAHEPDDVEHLRDALDELRVSAGG